MSKSSQSNGRLVVISGPSGAGKSSVLERVLADCILPLQMSVSATTRPPRPGETNGVHYWFLTTQEFARRREAGDFLECFEVFGRGHWYGTLRETVSTGLRAGKWVILEIDVQGAAEVCRAFPDAISLFVHPGSLTELERRLRGRQTESEAAIKDRLETARREVATSHWYQHTIVNDNLADCAAAICSILEDHDRNA
jgi:guanylate kinase